MKRSSLYSYPSRRNVVYGRKVWLPSQPLAAQAGLRL